MPVKESYTPGSFCWFDLTTSDAAAAREFYGALFGWTFENAMPEGQGEYWMASIGDQEVGAIGLLQDEQKQMGIPPHWMSYVSVEDADATAAKVEGAGGKLLMAPFDVFDVGRMAVTQGPDDAMLNLWQAKKHIGQTLYNQHGTVCWNELMTRDLGKVKPYLEGLFGWTLKDEDMGGTPYTMAFAGEEMACGMMQMDDKFPPEVPNHWLAYWLVDDLEATSAKVAEKGGEVMHPKTDIGFGWFAVAHDPQGAVFGLFESKPEHKEG